MLVGCSLANLTDYHRQSRPVHEALRLHYATPERKALAEPEDLHDVLRPLGLWRRRASSLVKLARMWVESGPPVDAAKALKYPGVGQYGSDSWAIFLDGRTDVQPNDGKLGWYMDQLRNPNDRENAE